MDEEIKSRLKNIQITARDADYRNNMHEILDILRQEKPVYKDENYQRWVITTYKGVHETLKNVQGCGRDWSVAAENTWGGVLAKKTKGTFGMLDVDGAEHRRLRNSISKEFSPKAVLALQPMIEAVADELIDKVRTLESFDLISMITAPFPTIIISQMLGVDKKDQQQFKSWSDDWVYNLGPAVSKENEAIGAKAFASLSDYLQKAVEERVTQDKDDLLSRLIHRSEQADQLTQKEIVTLGLLLILAGNLTSTDVIGNGIVALIRNPEQLEKLRANPDLYTKATDEILRLEPPITETIRFLKLDCDIEDVHIEKGQTLMLNLAAANHDTAVYQCPHQMDITRNGPPSVSFGGGNHLCLGIHLAKLEIRIILQKFLEAFPFLELSEEPERRDISFFNGYKKIMVSIKPK